MKVIFAGTPEFAAQALQAIIDAGHQVSLVLTQPDRPAGRGLAMQASAVKQCAQAAGIEVFQPVSLKDAATQARILAVGADIMVVAAYGLILPQAVLDMPRLGCINIHASLLPRWRGAAPIQRAILAGDKETGVCIMQMEAGLDTGPILSSAALSITNDDTSLTLHNKLASLGAQLIVDALARLPLSPCLQPTAGVTYADKIGKCEAALDWRQPAVDLKRHVQAFNPFPGAFSSLAGSTLKIWAVELSELAEEGADRCEPGVVLAVDKRGIVVACGEGALLLVELQKAGGKRLPVKQFLAGTPVLAGHRFTLPSA
jgi:methionyl-tRNA formyltransferase